MTCLRTLLASLVLLFVLFGSCAAVTIEEYKALTPTQALIDGTKFEGSCRSPAAVNTTGGGTTAKVCLPEGNSITYNLTQMTTLSTGQLYETYTFGAAQTTINGSEYTWPEIVATNLTANVTQLSTADDGNLIIARMTDAAGFCWWVRINVREKTYQEYGNYKLSSEDDIPDACPPRPADNVAYPSLICDGDTLVYLCNGVLTAGDWPSPSSASTLRTFLALEPLLALF